MKFKTFAEYVQMREGLWVADICMSLLLRILEEVLTGGKGRKT
jgi:hypothetical protein